MKPTNTISIFIKFSFLLLIMAESSVFSEERTDSIKIHPGFFAGISGGASKNRIRYEVIPSLIDINQKNIFSVSGNFGFEIGYFSSHSTGISTGIGYSSYNTELLLNTYENSFITTDSENETYEKRVSGSAIKEIQNISFLSIPVCLNFQIPAGHAIGFFLKVGVRLSIPVKHEYNSTGTFTFTGYYPAYNILFHDLPEYGFPGNAEIAGRGDIDLRPLIVEGMTNAGIQYTIKSRFRISAGLCYSRSLSDISNYHSPGNFQLSSDVNAINSLMGGFKSSVAESFGVNISLIYFLK